MLSGDAASATLGTECIMGIPASQGFLLIFLPEEREASNERLKFFLGIMILLGYKSVFGLFFIVLFSIAFISEGRSHSLSSPTVLSAVSISRCSIDFSISNILHENIDSFA